jgi:hypothetical protein
VLRELLKVQGRLGELGLVSNWWHEFPLSWERVVLKDELTLFLIVEFHDQIAKLFVSLVSWDDLVLSVRLIRSNHNSFMVLVLLL